MGSQLTDLVRQKFPGKYDDMSDDDLESAVLSKHPEYKDLVKPTTTTTVPPVDDTTPNTPDFKTEVNATADVPEQGWLSKGYHALTDPLTDAPSRFGESISKYMTNPVEGESPAWAMTKGAVGGGLKGIGDVVSGFTSPLNLATMGMAGAEGVAGKAGLEAIASAMNTGQKLAAVPMVAHGGYEALRPDATMGERGMGLTEMVGGLAAGMHSPTEPNVKMPEAIRPEILSEMNEAVIPHDMVPVGGEEAFNGQFATEKPLGTDEVSFNLARDKFNMGQDIPSTEMMRPDESRGSTVDEPISEVTDKPKGVLGNNVNVILKADKATPEAIKRAMEAGYELIGHNDNGDFRFRKTDKPVDAPILESELPQGKRLPLGPKTDVERGNSIYQKVNNFSRSMMATMDMSGPLRQGIGLVHKPAFWKALMPMIKSFGSEKVFQQTMDSIAERPLFKTSVDSAGNYIPSFAEKSGLKLTDLGDISKREEALMSTLAEKWVPGVRNSERAYTIFLNKLRADTFESLIKSGKVLGVDGETNTPLAKSLAEFVNNATGRGSLGKLESSADFLNKTLFAPRLIASRLHMMDPRNYVAGDPMVRKEYLKSLLAIVAAGNTIGQIAKLAGADVSSEPTSSDFGKIKIGNIRLDPFAGFQQYAVLASRLLENKTTSSTSGKSYTLGEKFGKQTRFDVAERFAESKLTPMLSLATAFLHGKDLAGNKFYLPEEVATRFVPLFVQDLKNLLTEDPNITSGYDKELHPENLPLAIPGFFGMGTQLYGDRTKSIR